MGFVDPYAYSIDAERYRRGDHRWLDELDQLAVHAGPPHQRMGTRAIDEAEWLLLDEHHAAETALRARLVAEARHEVFGCVAGSEAATAEAAELVQRWLARHGGDGSRAPDAAPDALGVAGGEAEPLVRAGLAVQEDLCLMQRDEAGWRLTAALLCFPTYWRLHDKLGHTQQDVHGPVPHYADDLSDKVGRFFDRLSPGRVVSRRNWGFSAHPLLFAPDLTQLRQEPGFDPSHLWLRSERQTLRRLPDSGAVLFTIRVQLAPAEALLSRPALAGRLAAAIEGWTPELAASRGGRHGFLTHVTAWLRAIAPDSTPPAGYRSV